MVVINEHRSGRALATLLVMMGAWLGAPGAGSAQGLPEVELPKLQLQRFRPAPGPADFINVYGSPVPKHLDWDFGAYLDFADDPLNIATAGIGGSALDRSTVDEQLTLSLIANIGLGDQFEVGLLWPITLFQTSDELQPIMLNDPSFSSNSLQRTALNDPRITGKWRIVELAEHGYGLALVSALYLPLATQNSLTSDGGVGAELLMAADAFLYKGVRGGVNAGFRYRPSRRELRGNVLGNEIIWGLAASIPMFMEKLDALLELDGAVSVATRPDNQSCCREGEVYVGTRAALRYRVRPEWSLTGGVGAGATEGIGAPDYRVFLGLTGHWVTGGDWGYDFDNDGIYGERDLCPDEEEDFDGFEDADGCPDPDNDRDGILDVDDKCPNDPETYNGFEDEDGCPDEVPEEVKQFTGVIKGIHFDFGKATIRAGSHGLLDQAAQVRGLEVGGPDGAYQPAFACLDQPLPGLDIKVLVRVGPVDQDQVCVVQAQGREVVLHPGHGVGVPFLVELGGDEQFFAREARFPNGLAHTRLVAIVLRGVDEPVADLESGQAHLLDLAVIERPGAETDRGDGRPAVQGEGGGKFGHAPHSHPTGGSGKPLR